MEDNKKIYRPNVSAIILSPRYPEVCEVLIAHRVDIEGAWQFPQGGINDNETPQEALFRELKEEIGTDEVEIISECLEWISYDFPPKVQERKKPFIGQRQKYFLVKLKPTAKINVSTEIPEFKDFKFVGLDNLLEQVSPIKREIYQKALEHFKSQLCN